MHGMHNTLFKVGDLIEHKYSDGYYIIVGFGDTEDPNIQMCQFLFVSPRIKQSMFCGFLDIELKQSCIKIK